MQAVQVQRVHWSVDRWVDDGEPLYGVNQTDHSLWIDMEPPQAVLVRLP